MKFCWGYSRGWVGEGQEAINGLKTRHFCMICMIQPIRTVGYLYLVMCILVWNGQKINNWQGCTGLHTQEVIPLHLVKWMLKKLPARQKQLWNHKEHLPYYSIPCRINAQGVQVKERELKFIWDMSVLKRLSLIPNASRALASVSLTTWYFNSLV